MPRPSSRISHPLLPLGYLYFCLLFPSLPFPSPSPRLNRFPQAFSSPSVLLPPSRPINICALSITGEQKRRSGSSKLSLWTDSSLLMDVVFGRTFVRSFVCAEASPVWMCSACFCLIMFSSAFQFSLVPVLFCLRVCSSLSLLFLSYFV